MTLKDLIQSDIDNVFFKDETEFSEYYTVFTNTSNAVKIIASLQANDVQNNSGNGQALVQFSHTFICPTTPLAPLRLRPGASVYINGSAYRINSLHDEMGVTTMLIQKG